MPVAVSKLREACPVELVVRFDAAMTGRSEVTRGEALDLMTGAALASPRALLRDGAAPAHLSKIFEALDLDEDGSLDASELLYALLRIGDASLDEEAVCALIRECDTNGDGAIQPDEFRQLLRAPPPPGDRDEAPHLVLNFDVNKTVLMLDSATATDRDAMLSIVLASNAWGDVVDGSWVLDAAAAVGPVSPDASKVSYSMFATRQTPIGDDPRGAKNRRRDLLQQFCDAGHPGASLRPTLAGLANALPTASLLLPSFLRALRALKRRKRSFSVVFRTFGKDLGKIADEFNALCSNSLPVPTDADGDGDEDGGVVLDGSDGQADLRVRVGDGEAGCGTFVRDGTDDGVAIVFGTLEQPPADRSTSLEDALRWYDDHKTDVVVDIAKGPEAARDALRKRSNDPEKTGTLALRDSFRGWEAAKCTAKGGKPIFVEDEDTSVHQIFFDDHILPNDAHIVDARSATNVSRRLPISAVLHSTLVRAEPFQSITDPNYFINAIDAAENAWRLAAVRRRRLAVALANADVQVFDQTNLSDVPDANGDKPKPRPSYVPHRQTVYVAHASDVPTFDVDDEIDRDLLTPD